MREIYRNGGWERLRGAVVTTNDDGLPKLKINVEQANQLMKDPKAKDGKLARANYVHPLLDLDGEPLTEDFPADHPHHRGVFWAWHQVRIGGRQPSFATMSPSR